MNSSPTLTPLADLFQQLLASGWAVLSRASLCELAGLQASNFEAWAPLWHDLPPDRHLRDGGRYRRRRHGCFVVKDRQCAQVPHRPHWQPVEYNALHGGIQRHFDPLHPQLVADPAWTQLLVALAGVASEMRSAVAWYVEAHPFRIDASEGIGRPTPEGAHRDGVDLVAVVFVGRHNVKGGETRVFDAFGPQGVRFTLSEP